MSRTMSRKPKRRAPTTPPKNVLCGVAEKKSGASWRRETRSMATMLLTNSDDPGLVNSRFNIREKVK